MAEIQCFHCKHHWALRDAHSNRCPNCGWITEIYYDEGKAKQVAEVYNQQSPALPEPSGVAPLIGMRGFSVSFPDQGRLSDIAEQLLAIESH